MNFLAIECSTDTLSLAASNLSETWYYECAGGALTSRILVPECLKGLAHLNLRMQDLDAIIYGRGPGSFTGLRTACSVAQGFAYPHRTSCLGLDSLLTMAQSARSSGHLVERVFCVLDARMGQLYIAAFSHISEHWHVLVEPSLVNPEMVEVPLPWLTKDFEDPFLLVTNTQGEVHETLLNAIRAKGMSHQTLMMTPRADAMIELARAQYRISDPQALHHGINGLPTPLYIRNRVAQTTLERSMAHQTPLPSTP